MSAPSTATRATDTASVCHQNVVTIPPGEDIASAARIMRSAHVGFLVVCETRSGGGGQKVVGVLTDRDIVLAVVAREADPRALKVLDVMTRNPLIVSDSCPVDAALGLMRETGVRRVPVVGANDELVGILSLDDVIERMAQQLTNIACAYRGEQRAERIARP